jgi:hypothetical protein
MTRWGRLAVGAGILALFCAYFLGTVTAPPNADDGGIAFGYIDRIARGERLHFDFLDYYGPLTYLLPAWAYALTGKTVIGVRLWLVVLKLLTLAASYFAVRRLTDRFFGLLAACVLGVLLGLPWAMFQIPYAHHSTLPCVLLVVGLMFESGRLPGVRRLFACGLLTAAAALMKVSIGAFAMLGALLYLFYWAAPEAGTSRTESARLVRAVRMAQGLGLLVIPAILHGFISEHFNWGYFFYLTAPTLLVVIACSGKVLSDIRAQSPVGHLLRGWATYLGATVVAYLAVLLAFLGPSAVLPYLREQHAVLRTMQLVADFEPVGLRGLYRGYGEYLWPQLPWLLTLLYMMWSLFARRHASDAGIDHRANARMFGMFAVATLHGYVIYSVPDDAHIMQHVLLVAPLLFVPLHHVGRMFGPRAFVRWRVGVAAAALTYASTLVFIPPRDAYTMGRGDWHSPRLAHLTYHRSWTPWANPTNPQISDRMLDEQLDRAARQIDTLTDEGEAILVLAPLHLLYYASHTLPVLPRYSQLFYLLGHGRLTPEHFRELVPESELSKLVAHPPRLIVRVHGHERLIEALPELASALTAGNYRMVGRWGVLRIYLRDG